MKRFILQAVNEEDHLAPAREVFGLAALQTATISTAFMTASGLSLLQDVMEPIANRARIFVGIRNGITTVQSIQKALEIGCETYMVDTGSRQQIFHPKMYYSRSATHAKLLLGSANLTMGGLRTNIEASVMLELGTATDAAFLADLDGKLDAMIAGYPDNVIRAVDAAQLANLQRAGRLIDERRSRPPEPSGSSADRALDNVPRMPLRTSPIKVAKAVEPPPQAAPAVAPVVKERMEQVWESKGLAERDLMIPSGANTNPAGSMLFKLGAWEGIDHQIYFRDDVFSHLTWEYDTAPKKIHLERAAATFRIIIKSIDYGEFELKLSHDSRDTEKIRRARNSKTQLHWGEVKPMIARRDLLDSILRLYRETNDPTRFTLEID